MTVTSAAPSMVPQSSHDSRNHCKERCLGVVSDGTRHLERDRRVKLRVCDQGSDTDIVDGSITPTEGCGCLELLLKQPGGVMAPAS